MEKSFAVGTANLQGIIITPSDELSCDPALRTFRKLRGNLRKKAVQILLLARFQVV